MYAVRVAGQDRLDELTVAVEVELRTDRPVIPKDGCDMEPGEGALAFHQGHAVGQVLHSLGDLQALGDEINRADSGLGLG